MLLLKRNNFNQKSSCNS